MEFTTLAEFTKVTVILDGETLHLPVPAGTTLADLAQAISAIRPSEP